MATEQQVHKLAAILVEHQDSFKALTNEEAQWVIMKGKEATELCVLALKNRGTIIPQIVQSNLLTVPYSRSIEDSLTAGNYDSTNSNITTKKFGDDMTGTKDVETKMYHWGVDISSENAIAKMKAEGFRPATMKELLAYGEKFPEEQRKYPIVALGSVAEVFLNRVVGVLREDGSERHADLDCFGGGWGGRYRFLAVRI